jgi:hypothetical protein
MVRFDLSIRVSNCISLVVTVSDATRPQSSTPDRLRALGTGPRRSRPLEPARHRATNALASVAILRRRRHPLSMRPRPSARPSGGATVRLTWQDQGKRHLSPRSRRRQKHDYRHTMPLRTHPTPLVRQQAVERRFGERKRNRRFRTGTSATEHDYDRRYSARL